MCASWCGCVCACLCDKVDGCIVRGGKEEWIRYLSGFVLCDFVLGVFLALFALAIGAARFGNLQYDISPSVCLLQRVGRSKMIREWGLSALKTRLRRGSVGCDDTYVDLERSRCVSNGTARE